MKEFGKNYETFLAAAYISINRWTAVWSPVMLQCCSLRRSQCYAILCITLNRWVELCGYRGVEGGTSDLVNWEGPWMPRGPDLGVLPSLHGVMYKHWIIKLHLSIPLHPVLGRLCQTLSRHLLYLPSSDLPLKLPLLSFSNVQFFGFFCFVSVYCLELSAIFPAVIAHKEWEAGNSKRR